MSRRALVTGGSRGIGAAIVRELARAGHRLTICYQSDREAAEKVAHEVTELGAEANILGFDVRDREQVEEALKGLGVDHDPIEILVNNAGIARDSAFPAMSHDDWQRVVATTLDGFFHVTHYLLMPMIRRRWGRIVNIASIAGIQGNRGQANYAAAKAGLIGATKSLALEVAKRGITVNAVAPGLIDTDMLDQAPVDRIVPMIPMQRIGRAEEVAYLVRFLTSDEASYITRQVITIDGGLS